MNLTKLYIDAKLSKNMEKKEEDRGKVLVTTAILLIALVAFHTYYNFYGLGFPTSKSISGNSVSDDPDTSTSKVSTKTRWIIASEWFLVILVMLYILIKAKKRFQKEAKTDDSIKNVSLKKGRNKTDIDLLYELLLAKKSLRITAIAKYFKVSKEVAMGWCQILEEGNLAEITYPTVGDPKIGLYENEEKQNETKQKTQN